MPLVRTASATASGDTTSGDARSWVSVTPENEDRLTETGDARNWASVRPEKDERLTETGAARNCRSVSPPNEDRLTGTGAARNCASVRPLPPLPPDTVTGIGFSVVTSCTEPSPPM